MLRAVGGCSNGVIDIVLDFTDRYNYNLRVRIVFLSEHVCVCGVSLCRSVGEFACLCVSDTK